MGRSAGKAKSNQLPPKLMRKNKKGNGHAFELKINAKSGSQDRPILVNPRIGNQ